MGTFRIGIVSRLYFIDNIFLSLKYNFFFRAIGRARRPVDVCSVPTGVERCTRSSGPWLCADRSEAKTTRTFEATGSLREKEKAPCFCMMLFFFRAIDGARTRGLDLGKVARYQLRHYRISVAVCQRLD